MSTAQIAANKAPKSKIEKKLKGKENADNSQKSERAAEAKEKMETFTPLNTAREQIMISLQRFNKLPEPYAMIASLVKMGNPITRYAYPNDFGHLTEGCITLKKAIRRLID